VRCAAVKSTAQLILSFHDDLFNEVTRIILCSFVFAVSRLSLKFGYDELKILGKS